MRERIRVTAVSPSLSHLLDWAEDDPETRMQPLAREAFRAGWEAAGRSAEPVPVVPSILQLAPSTRRAFAATFREAAAACTEARCSDLAQKCNDHADALDFGGAAGLAQILEATP